MEGGTAPTHTPVDSGLAFFYPLLLSLISVLGKGKKGLGFKGFAA